MQIRIGTRKSKLALIQTNMVIRVIERHFPGAECIIVPMVTTGDKITDRNLYDIGGKALFLKELEEALLANEIDLAVHSLKDVPGILPEGLLVAAVLEREDARDCFISADYKSIQELPHGSVIGTSSVRRKIIIQQERPDLKLVQFRGNINTRLDKLKNSDIDATILAAAGLIRSSLFDPAYCHMIETSQMLPAAGQGIIGIEIRDDDALTREICAKINHLPTWSVAQAERSFLAYLDASCRTPLSAYAVLSGGVILARYMLSDDDGRFVFHHEEEAEEEHASDMGESAGEKLLARLKAAVMQQ
ncbi:MAG: hydroxymethylbilane synthase [Rickettsiales bacterium]|nr:MAG: hydroxymethylbilane synthase [Rickettsiales bacterium]